jgi:hypothetical protein
MFIKKKITLILLVAALGLTACGSLSKSEPASVKEESAQPLAASSQESAGTVEMTTVSDNAQVQAQPSTSLTYPIVDTDQGKCYGAQSQMDCPQQGTAFFGQDAQYDGNQPSYMDNDDGTITDNVTGLMWQKDPGEKMTYQQAVVGADSFTLAGYDDWRLPTIKELYSLIQFDGLDPSGPGTSGLIPFIDTDYFAFEYGDESTGERIIDSQWATSSLYTSTTINGAQTMFGVNFADGRIKGYPTEGRGPSGEKTYFVIYVRGNAAYGQNSFVDNGNDTITDNATGLTWTQSDSGVGMNYEAALNYCESLDTGGSSNWRLPNVKELQSLVDYSRSPDGTNSAAIGPIFDTSTITNEAGQLDYPAFWSSTTHASLRGGNGAYINFGRSMGYMNGQWIDVHGAGAQRSDPKTGSSADYPTGHGPQGDAIRVDNYVRCVTDSSTTTNVGGDSSTASSTGPAEQGSQPPSGQPAQGQNQTGEQGRPQIDFVSAAAQLGVTEDALRAALGAPPPDFDAAAAELGVTVEELIAALGIPAGGPPQPPAGAPQG